MSTPHGNRSAFVTRRYFLAALALLGLITAGSAGAFNYVTDANGTWWGIQDNESPFVDTGSIRATQTGPGDCLFNPCTTPPYSTSINGFAGIKLLVQTTPAPRFNGEIMRGYGLTFDGVNRFATTRSIDLGGVTTSRSVYINNAANWGRWLDSFTNTTKAPITIKAAFGGQSGIGTATGSTPGNSSSIVNTSSGDAVVTPADAWVDVATPLNGTTPVGGPQVTVLGTPTFSAMPFRGAMTFAGNWLFDTFNNPLSYVGHEANFQAYVNTITLQPGRTRSVLHFVVLGQMVTAASSAGVRAAVEATASDLAAHPDIADLTTAEICSIDNFSAAALSAHGFEYAACMAKNRKALEVAQAPVPKEPKMKTNVKYDVVGKTVQQLRADLEAGVTTSKEITEAYLDRIEAYDKGQFGFHAFEIVAENAIEQA